MPTPHRSTKKKLERKQGVKIMLFNLASPSTYLHTWTICTRLAYLLRNIILFLLKFSSSLLLNFIFSPSFFAFCSSKIAIQFQKRRHFKRNTPLKSTIFWKKVKLWCRRKKEWKFTFQVRIRGVWWTHTFVHVTPSCCTTDGLWMVCGRCLEGSFT